jgi:hypothetical protein
VRTAKPPSRRRAALTGRAGGDRVASWVGIGWRSHSRGIGVPAT